MTDDSRLSLASATGSPRALSFRSSASSSTTIPQSEFSFGYNYSDASSGLTTPIEPSYTRSPSPSAYFKPLPPSLLAANFKPLPPSLLAANFKPLPPSVLAANLKEHPQKPLPPPPPPAKDSDLLDLILILQSMNRNMKILNASLSSLTEDMSSIETMLITRELLVQDLAGQPGGGGTDGDFDHMYEGDERFASSKKYLRHLYQKFAQTSMSYTQ